MTTSREFGRWEDYRPLHLAVPVFSFRAGGPEDLQVPFSAAPGLDDFRRDDIDQDLGERPSFRIPFEVVGGLVPCEAAIEDHREKEVVAVVHHDELAAGALQRG